jgi:hypothetical protein
MWMKYLILPPAPMATDALPQKNACNSTQNAQQHYQHECCTYQHPPQPHPDGIQATLRAGEDDGSQCSLPTMY